MKHKAVFAISLLLAVSVLFTAGGKQDELSRLRPLKQHNGTQTSS